MPRRTLAAVAAALLVLGAATSCSRNQAADTKNFCDELSTFEDAAGVFNGLVDQPPQELADAVRQNLPDYRLMERTAPRAVRDDVATVVSGIDQVLVVLDRYPQGGPDLQDALTNLSPQLLKAYEALKHISTFAKEHCGAALVNPLTGFGGGESGSTTSPGPGGVPTSTTTP